MKINNDKIIDFYIKNSATIEEVIELRKYLDELQDAANKLSYLEAYGVDNWGGYDIAMHEYYKGEEE